MYDDLLLKLYFVPHQVLLLDNSVMVLSGDWFTSHLTQRPNLASLSNKKRRISSYCDCSLHNFHPITFCGHPFNCTGSLNLSSRNVCTGKVKNLFFPADKQLNEYTLINMPFMFGFISRATIPAEDNNQLYSNQWLHTIYKILQPQIVNQSSVTYFLLYTWIPWAQEGLR